MGIAGRERDPQRLKQVEAKFNDMVQWNRLSRAEVEPLIAEFMSQYFMAWLKKHRIAGSIAGNYDLYVRVRQALVDEWKRCPFAIKE